MDPYLSYLVEVNKSFHDQIKTADQKAAYIFTFILALLVWSAETRASFKLEHILAGAWYVRLSSIVLGLAIATALIATIGVVLPRKRPGRSIQYWGAWPTAGERLVAARTQDQADFFFAEYLQNTTTLANICQAKYRLVRIGFTALFVAVAAYVTLLVLS